MIHLSVVLDLEKAKDAQAKEITLAQTLIQIKAAKPKVLTTAATTTTTTRPKARGVVVQDPSEFRTPQELQPSMIKDKGKAIMIEPELKAKKETEEISTGTGDELESDKTKKAENSEEKAKGSRKKILGKKRAGKEQQQESSKRQRMEDDKETDEHEEVEVDNEAELKKHLVIVKDDDIAIDAIPLATKPPVIVEYKLLKEGIMAHYQLIRADGSSKRYSSMIRMLQDIDKEDLQTLWKLVKTKHGDIRPEDEHERVLWGDLKVMFEPDIKSDVWRNLQGYKVTIWKLYDSCGVHFVRFENVHIFMLVEKRYPLTPITITNMLLNKNPSKCHFNEIVLSTLKLMRMNIKFRGGLLGLKRLQGFLELLLLSNELDYDKLIEAQQVSIAMTISAKDAGEKENIAIVEKAVLANEVEKMVEGDEENPIEVCQENPGTRLEPGSHKEWENRNDEIMMINIVLMH
ncbi:hypothetical protein Tco_1264989 [Tanacetum coccineum]